MLMLTTACTILAASLTTAVPESLATDPTRCVVFDVPYRTDHVLEVVISQNYWADGCNGYYLTGLNFRAMVEPQETLVIVEDVSNLGTPGYAWATNYVAQTLMGCPKPDRGDVDVNRYVVLSHWSPRLVVTAPTALKLSYRLVHKDVPKRKTWLKDETR